MSKMNPTDDEILRAAMDDFDDGLGGGSYSPPMPPTPPSGGGYTPQPPIPPVPPTPQPQPPYVPPYTPQTKKKSKAIPIIAAVAVIAVIGIAAVVLLNQSHSSYVTDDYSYVDNGYVDNSDDGAYIDNSNENAVSEISVINPFGAVEAVIVDKTDDQCYLKFNTSYNETFDNVKVAYAGDENAFSDAGMVQVSELNGAKIADLFIQYEFGTYVSTGKVQLYIGNSSTGPSEDMFIDDGFRLSPAVAEFDAIACDFVKDGNEISASDMNTLEEIATATVTATYPLAKLEKVYFGYDGNGCGNSASPYSTGTFNEVRFAYSYNDGGYNSIATVTFFNLKITSEGELCNIAECDPDGKDAIESLSYIEENQPDRWTTYYEIN